MANWTNLKAVIANAIKANGNQEITGAVLQNTLNSIVNSVGENATFAGIATPTTNPGTPDGPVFYIASTAGVYANFSGIEIAEGEAVILQWSNGTWTKKTSGFVTQDKLTELESKLIRLTGIAGTSGSAGVSKVGDVYYNTDMKLLRKCVNFAGNIYETVPFQKDAIYSVDDVLYYYNEDSGDLEQYYEIIQKKVSVLEKDTSRNYHVASSEIKRFYSYQTGYEIGTTISPSPVSDTTVSCWKTSVKEGNKLAILGIGARNARLWCFTDSNYVILSVSKPGAGSRKTPTLIEAPQNAAHIFINLNNYDVLTDDIYDYGGWISENIVELNALRPKVVNLCGWAFNYSHGISGVTKVSDIYYDYKNNLLRECVDFENQTFKTVPFDISSTYVLKGKIYKSDGNTLIGDAANFDFSEKAVFSNLSFTNYSVHSGFPSVYNKARLCLPLLYADSNAVVKVKEGYAFYYYFVDLDGTTCMGYVESNTTEYTFKAVPTLVRLVFKKTDNTPISSLDDIVEVFKGFYITSDNLRFKFDNIYPWQPSSVDEGYSNPTSGDGRDTKREDWSAENKYKYYDFLEHYYDIYLGNSDNYRVGKRGLWVDSANTGHEVFEYDFCPKNYQYTIMLSAGLNTDETQGIWGLATFIRCLMNEEEPQIALMKKYIRFKVIPILNASGFDEDLLRYNYVDGTNPNMNFNYKDSWERNTQIWTSKGEYPDSCLETRGLKKWINDHSGIALLWLDLHTGRWGRSYPNKIIMDIRFGNEPSYFSKFNSVHAPLIKQFYIDKGYVTSKDSIGGANSQRENVDYQKHRYAIDVCGINSAMPEMHLESTGYGSDGFTNNSPEGIKAYVLQIRQLIIYAVNNV